MEVVRSETEKIDDLNILRAIDYSAHPAFRDLPHPASDCSPEIETALERIDSAVAELVAGSSLGPTAFGEEVARRVGPDFDRIAELTLKQLQGRPVATQCFTAAIGQARKRIIKEALYNYEKKSYAGSGSRSAAAERAFQDLQKQGFSIRRIPEARLKEIYELIAPYRQQLEQEAQRNGGARCDVPLPARGEHWKRVISIMEEEGFIQAACDTLRHQVETVYCALVLSHPDMKWWKSCYGDVGLPTSSAATMHFDADFDLVKALVYLSDVEPGNGPFSLIPYSHLWPRSPAHLAIVYALDTTFIETLAPLPPKESVYWRKLFQPPYREDFAALPRIFQATTGFGDDLQNGSELSEKLLKAERPLLSREGNCFLFTSSSVIHRGGIAQTGRRWVLQIGFMQKPSLITRVIRKLRRMLSKGLGKPMMR